MRWKSKKKMIDGIALRTHPIAMMLTFMPGEPVSGLPPSAVAIMIGSVWVLLLGRRMSGIMYSFQSQIKIIAARVARVGRINGKIMLRSNLQLETPST